jgi:protein phosphatase 2C family protein 2/3
LSTDHNTSNEKELKRIIQAGGYIEKGRINGDLTVSRGLGDFSFKKNKYEKL